MKKNYKTLKGLARIIKRNYNDMFQVSLCKDDEGYYLVGHAKNSFPSVNYDRITTIKFPYTNENEILNQIKSISCIDDLKNQITLI